MKKVLLLGDGVPQDHIDKLTPDGKGLCNGCHFTTDLAQQPFDAVVRYHTLAKDVTTTVRQGNFFAFPVEYHSGYLDDGNGWVVDNNGDYDYLIGCFDILKNKPRVIRSIHNVAWSEKNYTYWSNMPVPQKTIDKNICWITSNFIEMPGHRKRMEFYRAIAHKMDNLSMYGKGFYPLDNKEHILQKYKYGIAFENGSEVYWHTEKILDIWLNYGLPFYYGAKKLDALYPPESFMYIDSTKPAEAMDIMQQAIWDNEWERRLPAIRQARHLALNPYNVMHRLADVIHTHHTKNEYIEMRIARNTQYTIKHRFYDRIRKLRKSIWKRRVGYYNW